MVCPETLWLMSQIVYSMFISAGSFPVDSVHSEATIPIGRQGRSPRNSSS